MAGVCWYGQCLLRWTAFVSMAGVCYVADVCWYGQCLLRWPVSVGMSNVC